MAAQWDDAIVRELYAALLGRRSWAGALSQLGRAFDAPICQLATYDRHSGDLIPDADAALAPPDPRWSVLDLHAAEAWAANPQAPGVEVLKSARIPPMLCARLTESLRQVTFAWIVRRPGAPVFTAPEIRLAQVYFDALSTVLKLWRRLSGLEKIGSIAHRMLRSADAPSYLLDGTGRVRGLSDSARGCPHVVRHFSVTSGYLRVRSPIGQLALDEAFATLRDRAAAEPACGPLRQAVRLVDNPGAAGNQTMHCSLWFLNAAGVASGDPTAAAVERRAWAERWLLVVPATLRAIDTAQNARHVARLFELSPVEAQIAVAIADGADAAGLASSRQVTVATVRSQLAALLQKTQSRRQVEVVGKVLRALRR